MSDEHHDDHLRAAGEAADGDGDPAPSTRRSSPLPSGETDQEMSIPRLRPLPFEVRPTDDYGEDTQSDIAPIGPTELSFDTEAPSARPVDPPAPPATVEQLEQQIRDLEARLDEMIARGATDSRRGPASSPPASGPRRSDSPPEPPISVVEQAPHKASSRQPSSAAPPPPPRAVPPPRPSAPTARELLTTDFYLHQWGRAGMRRRAEEVDEFGLDPQYEARFLPLFDFLYKHYFRVETSGAENIPDEGRCLIVSNHSGGPLPYDGIMLRTAVRREHPSHRELRWLAEDFIYHLPFVGTAMNRLGAVRACQENAERLLATGRLCAVFPEGAKGIGKLYKDRYRLQRFGRGGFIRLCLRAGTPIVPCAIVGAEEANPMLYRIEYMTKTLGIPYLPITPTFPALGPLGLLPAPTKWKLTFGEPISFEGYGPDAEGDDVLVGRLAERVRATIQSMLDATLAGRGSVWFG